MKTTVKISGLRELDEMLGRELPKAAAKGVLVRVGKKALVPFDERWRQLAPDDPETGGDDLKSSGGISTKLTKRQASANRKREDKSFAEVYAGPNDPAAVPQEFGTVNHPPQPFARPAWDETHRQVLEIVKNELGGEIMRTVERRAKRAAARAAKAGK